MGSVNVNSPCKIYNNAGILIREYNAPAKIDISKLSNGTYFIKENNNPSVTRKIIIKK